MYFKLMGRIYIFVDLCHLYTKEYKGQVKKKNFQFFERVSQFLEILSQFFEILSQFLEIVISISSRYYVNFLRY